SDACGIASKTLSQTAFDCTHIATSPVTITMTVTDNNSNVSTCTAAITVEDNVNPVISGMPANDIAQDADAGQCGAVVTWLTVDPDCDCDLEFCPEVCLIGPEANDNCAIASFTSTHESGDTFPVGTTTVTYTATDVNGNVQTASFDVVISDEEDPAFGLVYTEDFENETPYDADDLCSAGNEYTPADANWSLGPACAVPSNGIPRLVDVDGDTFLEFNNQYPNDSEVWNSAAIDVSGQPNIAISFDARSEGGLENSGASIDEFEVFAVLDDVEEASPLVSLTGHVDGTGDGSFYDVDESFSAIVATGGAATLSLRLKVRISGADGSESYLINNVSIGGSMPSDITMDSNAGGCGAVVNWAAPGATDNCGIASVVSSHNPGDIFSPGPTTVTYTATDVNGNTTMESFNVTVNDVQDPVFGGLYRESFELETPFDADDLCATGNEYSPADANWSLGPACSVPTNGIPQLVDVAGDTYLKYNYKYPAGSEVWNSAPVNVSGLTSVTVSFDARSEGGLENAGTFIDDFAMYAVIDGTQSATPLVAFNGHVDGTGGTKTEEQSFSETVSLSSASSLSLRIVVNISGSDGSESYLINDVAIDEPLLADISLNSDAGICGADATWDTPAVYDNCGVTSLVPTHASGTTFAVGTTTVTYTASDAAGNQATDSFTVTVADTENPTISASDENVTTDLDACTAVVNYTAPTTSDNCEVSSVTYDIADGSTFALGTTTVTATVTDIHSNTNTTTFDVIVTDGQAPNVTAEAADLTVECDGAGNNAELLAWLANNGGATATDNCSTLDSDSWSNDFTTLAYTCGSTSSVNVVFTVTDEAGNQSTTQATFTIEDTTSPTLDTSASNETVECDGAGNTAQFQAWLNNHGGAAASEVCSEVTWSHNYGQLNTEGQLVTMSDLCGETGSVLVTFTASDNCDNTVTTQATFTIEDTTPPTAIGQDYTLVLDATGNAVLNPASINNSSSDNCGSVTPTASTTNFSCANLGPNTVTLTITDACNLTDTQDVTVTVVDQTDPTIVTAASDATFECSSSDDYATELSQWLANNGGATATDACGNSSLTWSYSPNPAELIGACGNTSSLVVTFTVSDPSGNSSDTQATFSIEDTTPPAIASEATDVTVECDGAGNTSDLAAWLASNGGAGIATDECGGVSWSNNFTGLGMTCAGSGAVEVIFTASDDCGNESTTQATFTIEDTTPPSLTAQATDLTVECDGSGNTADLQAWLDSRGGATADPDLCGSNATWDESGYGNVSDLCAATGAVTIDFTLVDDCGNETVSTATFTIEDTTPPVALAHDFSVVLDGTGNASITTADIDNGSYDNCGDVTLSLNITQFTCADVGAQPVELTVADECGVASTATAIVQVTASDESDPTFSNLPGDITQTADPDMCSAAVTWVNPSVADNCGAGTLTTSHDPNDVFPVGTTTVTFTADDGNGNTSTATMDITVTDDEDPVITNMPSNFDVGTDPTACGAVVTWDAPQATDNCALASFTGTHSSGDTFPLGLTTVIYTAADTSGNSAQLSFTVTVTDDDAPVIAGVPSNITQTADAGQCDAVVNFTEPTASDNCIVYSFEGNYGSGDTFPLGTTTVSYTAEDVAGNSTTETFTVTITDDEDPVISDMPADITQTADAGECGAVVTWEYYDALTDTDVAPSSSDNCSIASFTSTHSDGDTFPVGTTTVTFTAVDGSSNTTTASFTVTITDDELPVFGALFTEGFDNETPFDANDLCVAGNEYTPADANWSLGPACAVPTNGIPRLVDIAGDTYLEFNNEYPFDSEVWNSADIDVNGMSTVAVSFDARSEGGLESSGGAVDEFDVYVVLDGTEQPDPIVSVVGHVDGSGDGTSYNVDASFSETVATAGAQTLSLRLKVRISGANASESYMINNVQVGADAPADIALNASTDACGAIAEWTEPSAMDNCGLTSLTSSHNSGDVFPVGPTTVTYTATDVNGNIATASFEVTVTDNQDPIFGRVYAESFEAETPYDADDLCVAGNEYTPADGNWSLGPACTVPTNGIPQLVDVNGDTYLKFNNEYPAGSEVWNSAEMDVSNHASLTVSFDARSEGGMEVSGPTVDEFEVYAVLDGVEAATPLVSAVGHVDGSGNSSAYNVDASFSETVTTGGAQTLSLRLKVRISAANGSESYLINNVVATAPLLEDISLTAGAGICSAVANWNDPAVLDNCGLASVTANYFSGESFGVGTATVTYTATDVNGNTATDSFTVTVTDDEDPVISGTPADITQTADAGQCGAVVNYTAPTVDDNCGVSSFEGDAGPGDTFPVGTTTVTYTATDDYGNTSTSSFDITITDDEAPVIADIPADITQTADAGQCGAVVEWEFFNAETDTDVAPSASDNCGVTSFTSTHNNGDTFAVGTTSVTFTAMDAAGNTTTSTFTVTITDDESPVIAGMPSDITQTADAGQCGAVVNYTAPTSIDNCAVTSFTSTHNSGDTFAVGNTTVTYTALDAAGNTSTGSFTVTVTDDEDPVIAGLQDISLNNDAGACQAVATWTNPTATDNCDVASLTGTHTSGTAFVVGTTTVTYTAVDIYGNTSQDSFTVTVTDNEDPVIASAAQDETVECDGAGNTTALNAWLAANGNAGSVTDNCGFDAWSNDYDASNFVTNCGQSGHVEVVFTATDIHGNTATTTATFTIEDTTPPYVVPVGLSTTVECDGAGNIAEYEAWHALWEDGVAISDICSGVTYGLVGETISDDCGETGSASKIYTMTDGCGNSTDTTITFTIEDTTPPAFNETLPVDGTFECDNVPTAEVLTATDVCSGDETVTFTETTTAGTCPDSYTITRTWSTTDDCSNTNTHVQTLTIQDTTSPSIDTDASDETVECDGAGNTAAFSAWLTNNAGAAASDNCGSVTWSNNSSGLSDLCGATGAETVTFTATDDCGNTSTTTATFTIEDKTDPSMDVASSDLTVECDGAGNTTELNNWLNSNGGASASDICGGVTWSHDFTALSDLCGATGAATVTFTATDDCGNTTTTTSVFTIEDTTVPSIDTAASDETVECDGAGNTAQLNAWLNTNGGAAASDDCGGVTWSNDFTALSDLCGATGAATVTFTATDDCGLTSTTTATFTIEDTTPPSMDVPASDMTVECDGAGNIAELNAWLTSNGGAVASEICSFVTWSNDFVALSDDCGATGSATVTFTATDDCGLATTTTATFTIEDTTPPAFSATAEDLTVECDGAGNTTELNNWLSSNGNAAASDICGGVTWSHDFIGLTDECGETGMTTVTFTVTDDCGNSVYTSAQFTIEDTTAPSMDVAASDMTVECDGAGNTSEFNSWLNSNGGASASDACSGVTWSNDFTALSDDCGATGSATVTFTATDDCGLSTSTTATFTIEDTTAPSMDVAASDMTVECDGAGNTAALNSWLTGNGGASASDVCGDVTWSNDFTALSDDCGATGAATVTFTATDACGNISSTTATFTIEDTTAPSMDVAA
ncbi:MAG: HYR domain-containing protein, partial [Flavobacteriales bacterium]|nr:HYR domain-containing protein [Flavobacteriales bacterium]